MRVAAAGALTVRGSFAAAAGAGLVRLSDNARWLSGCNAGGLAITVDDRNIAPIGTPGQVMRDVVLDPGRLLVQPGPAAN